MLFFASSAYSAGYRIGEILAIVLFGGAALLLARRAMRQPTHRGRVTDVVVAVLCAGLFVAAVVRVLPHHHSPWDTDQGRQLHAGFIAGCQQHSSVPMCDCLFDRLTSGPPGDTPGGFVMLGQSMYAASRRNDVRLLRPEIRAAVLACAGQAS